MAKVGETAAGRFHTKITKEQRIVAAIRFACRAVLN